MQQLPSLLNCGGFSTIPPAPGPTRLPLPLDDPIPGDVVWVLLDRDLAEHVTPFCQQVYIAGPRGYYPLLVDISLTPADMLWPIAVHLSGTGARTTWWFEETPWLVVPHRRLPSRLLHDFIPLALQCVVTGSMLHWNFAVETAELRTGELPEGMREPGTAREAEIPDVLTELERAHLPAALLHRSRSRSPRR